MPEIHDVDVADEPRLREWFDVWAAGQAHRPAELLPTWESARVPLSTPRDDFVVSLIGVREGETLAGVALLNLPMADNTTLAYADLITHPGHRRHGVGTALLAEIEQRARAAAQPPPAAPAEG